MEETRIRFMRCPYCGKEGGHTKKKGKTVGLFYVKELYNNVLIFECQKCLKVCRRRTMGSILQWVDMTADEKTAFKDRRFKEYIKTKSNGGNKNGNE